MAVSKFSSLHSFMPIPSWTVRAPGLFPVFFFFFLSFHVWPLNIAIILTRLKIPSRTIRKNTGNTDLGECVHPRPMSTFSENFPREFCSLQSFPGIWATKRLRLRCADLRPTMTVRAVAKLPWPVVYPVNVWMRLTCWSFTLLTLQNMTPAGVLGAC